MGIRGGSCDQDPRWATDPTIATAPVVTCLISPNLTDLNRQVVECPYSAKIPILLPDAAEVKDYIRFAVASLPGASDRCEVGPEAVAPKLVGLSRANIRALLHRTVDAGKPLTVAELSSLKKEIIEKECQGLLEFVESAPQPRPGGRT